MWLYKDYLREMINRNELRIGNWVKTYNFSDIEPYQDVQVKGIHPNGKLFFQSQGQPYTYWSLTEDKDGHCSIDPIPLTPEILKSCGLGATNGIEIKNNIWLVIHCDSDEANIYNIYKNETLQLKIECKYLHQLQNLMFALTGKELEVNLTEPVDSGNAEGRK